MHQSKCIVCKCKLKVRQRRPVNKHLGKYLRKTFLIESSESDFICGKCSRPAYRQAPFPVLHQANLQNGGQESTCCAGSPPSVRLRVQAASKSHAYCFICKKPGPKLIVVPQQLRTEVFVKHNILITAHSRCCPCHLDFSLSQFHPDTFVNFKSMDDAFVNKTTITELLDTVREFAIKSSVKRMSFENIEYYSDIDLQNMTGLNKEQFLDFHSMLKEHIRETPARSKSTTTGIFLFKMKTGISNSLLATLFGISKSSVRRAIAAVRTMLMQNFVQHYLGFQHISRENVIDTHTRTLAQSLLAEKNDQVILVIDGTYIYIQKSANFQFQRRSYSVHKGRPLVKPMVIVTTTGYFVSILGPYFSDSKNNDASILNHILCNNIEEIKEWIKPNDVFVVDHGFRDSITLLSNMGIHAEMPAFINKGVKQMPTEDANTSRLVTKVIYLRMFSM
ncbi:hypothetical protein DPMN_157378 [Dreissena polymorpha]|uniref:DDE Tnp4 domain-containing protein n=1 Tax=Dreissena polymorpha TaxID=45954 RepID=A0A9D4EH78_DREPO|nr:hypothetical protein DPMN_157378 [Dreissena polymorpha]